MGEAHEPLTVEARAILFDPWPRRRRLAVRALLGWMVLALLGMTLTHGASTVLPAVFTVQLLAAVPAGILAFVTAAVWRALGRSPAFGKLQIQGSALVVTTAGTQRRYPLDELADGWIEDADEVHLRTRNGDQLVARVATTCAAETLLAGAGLDASRRVLTVPLQPAASSIPAAGPLLVVIGLFITPVALGSLVALVESAGHVLAPDRSGRIGELLLAGLAATAVSWAALYAIYASLRRREAAIGTDGVVFRGAFRKVFLPYTRMVRVWRAPRGVRVLLRGTSRSVLLPTASALRVASRAAAEPGSMEHRTREVVLARIQQALAAGRAPDAASANAERLDRRGRALAAWRDELRGLLDGRRGYRTGELSPSDLARLIEDASAPAERRVAAAVALSSQDQAETRRRVRIAAEASVDADLRAALEAAAEGEIAEAPLARAGRRTAGG